MDIQIHFLLSALLALAFGLGKRDLIYFTGANLIDLDHLLSDPIYLSGRNSFETHLIHQNWLPVSVVSCVAWITEYRWLGMGILFHFAIDYLTF